MTRVSAGLIVLAGIVAAAGCGGSGSTPTGPTGGTTDTMTAMVDGQSWNAAQVQVVRNGTLVTIGGANTQLMGIGLVFTDSAGAFTIGSDLAATATVTMGSNSWTASAATGSGSITVTSITSTRVSGTFSFVAPTLESGVTPPSRTVTQGKFNVAF